MKKILMLTAALLCSPAMADQLADANVRNAAELMAYGTLCKTSEAKGLAARYSQMSGRPKDAKNLAAYRVKQVKASGKIKSFCRETKGNLPNFAEAAVSRNDPAQNPTVPGEVVERAMHDCKVAIPLQNSQQMVNLYNTCIEQQIGAWEIQQRYK